MEEKDRMIIEVPQPGLGIAAIAEIVTKGTPVLEERSSTVSPPEISTLKDFVTKSVHVLEAPTEAAPGSTPICNATKQRPNLIMHFMRHAEAHHKPSSSSSLLSGFQRISKSPSPGSIVDPDLNFRGREQCSYFAETFKWHAKYITHILSSPLVRSINTSCLAMRDVIDGGNGVMVWIMPELQSLGASPNGIGRSVADLKVIYGPGPKGGDAGEVCQQSRKDKEEDDTEHMCGDVALLKGSGREVELIPNSVKAEDAEEEQGGEFAGQVDFQFMCEDWNDEDEKTNGRWSCWKYNWRLERMKNFLSHLGNGKPGQRKEVVVVSHGSFLREFVDDVRWKAVGRRTFKFGEHGDLKEMSEKELIDDREMYGRD